MFADDMCIYVSDAYYDNVISTIQLSVDEVLNLATNNFMIIHPKTKQQKNMSITTWQKIQRILQSNESVTVSVNHFNRLIIFFLQSLIDFQISSLIIK